IGRTARLAAGKPAAHRRRPRETRHRRRRKRLQTAATFHHRTLRQPRHAAARCHLTHRRTGHLARPKYFPSKTQHTLPTFLPRGARPWNFRRSHSNIKSPRDARSSPRSRPSLSATPAGNFGTSHTPPLMLLPPHTPPKPWLNIPLR